MAFAASLSTEPVTQQAFESALEEVLDRFEERCDLLLAFTSRHHMEHIGRIAGRLAELAGASAGAVADGVLAGGREADSGPGVAIFGATLDSAEIRSHHIEAIRTPQGMAVGGLAGVEGVAGVVVFADPFTFPTSAFASHLGRSGVPVVGGLAHAGGGAGDAGLMTNGDVHRHGAVAITLAGDVAVTPLLSQGCRPLGEPAVVTAVTGTTLQSIAGRPALEYLTSLLRGLDAHDQDMIRQGLQLGVVMDEYKVDPGPGDFLIRGITGIDQEAGSIGVGERVQLGTTVQFQVRDPGGADSDLRAVLQGRSANGGVLLFTCNARGRRFFGEPDHDARIVREMLAPPAVAGFFSAGEIGPVGGDNYVHGYSASMVELRPAER